MTNIRSYRTLLRIILFVVLSLLNLGTVISAPVTTSSPSYPAWQGDINHTTYNHVWGAYRIHIRRLGLDNWRLYIFDKQGRIVREIQAACMDEIDYPTLLGGKLPELGVKTDPESNLTKNHYQFFFHQDSSGLRTVLAASGGIDEQKDLNGDGRPELITESGAALEWHSDFPHAGTPILALVYGWNGHAYQLENRLYPTFAKQQAAQDWSDLVDALHDPNSPDTEIANLAIGYYANAWTIHRGPAAHRWILRHLKRSARPFYLKAERDTLSQLIHLSDLIKTDQRRVWVVF